MRWADVPQRLGAITTPTKAHVHDDMVFVFVLHTYRFCFGKVAG